MKRIDYAFVGSCKIEMLELIFEVMDDIVCRKIDVANNEAKLYVHTSVPIKRRRLIKLMLDALPVFTSSPEGKYELDELTRLLSTENADVKEEIDSSVAKQWGEL